ncbi:MAG: hypothetical protein NT042_14580 [Sulfuritalea sp.]|nr:hypothetical protein [Sulfuritalea sp.]
MAQVINTNVAALFAGSALNKSAIDLQTAQQRLSSGLRINSAKDDASGLAIATGYDTRIRSTNATIRNSNDGISLAQTADGYLGPMRSSLKTPVSMRWLSTLLGLPGARRRLTAPSQPLATPLLTSLPISLMSRRLAPASAQTCRLWPLPSPACRSPR